MSTKTLLLAVASLLELAPRLAAAQPGPPGGLPRGPPGPRGPPALGGPPGRPTANPWLSLGGDWSQTGAVIVSATPATPTTQGGGFTTIVEPPPRTTTRPAVIVETTRSPFSTGDAAVTGISSSVPVLTDAPKPTSNSTTAGTGTHTDNMSNANATGSAFQPSRTLIITLSTVLSVVALLAFCIGIWCCCRYRRGRRPFFARGISPIDDEEIESWKDNNRASEKATEAGIGVGATAGAKTKHTSSSGASVSGVRKPPSVIVYQNPHAGYYQPRRSEDEYSPRSAGAGSGWRPSLDCYPQTPLVARAPNSRPGLTDETVQGDDAFIPSPKRRASRLSKLPPGSPRHARTRSARSSVSVGSWQGRGDQWYRHSHHHQHYPGTDVELSPRTSNELYYPRSSQSHDRKHHRVYSSSSNPPRLSLDDDYFVGGLSPRPLIRQSEIGRAIG